MQKQPSPVRGGEGESKKFEDWGVKNFRIGGGQGVTDLGCYFWWGGGQYPITCHVKVCCLSFVQHSFRDAVKWSIKVFS